MPRVAVGHDLRLRTLFEELGLERRTSSGPTTQAAFDRIDDTVDELLSDPVEVRDGLHRGTACTSPPRTGTGELLRGFAATTVGGCPHGRRRPLTGATGFVGTEVATRLLRRADLEIVALVLARSDGDAIQASERAWWYQPELRAALGDRIHAVAGDVTRPRLGLIRSACGSCAIGHPSCTPPPTCARRVRPGPAPGQRGRCREGLGARAVGPDSALVHVSTAYVAGRRGTVSEDDLTDAFGFASAYEQTKFEGERLVGQRPRSSPSRSFARP